MSLYVGGVMCLFKPLLYLGCRHVRVDGLKGLMGLLGQEDRGVLTVANHISVLDDPLVWAAMPWDSYLDPKKVRWTLGAHDILFANPLIAPIFKYGQVIDTHRGQGIYQPAVDLAIRKLDEGKWVHIFPEGRVNQRTDLDLEDAREGERDGRRHELLRFRWGISRMLMESRVLPHLVPIHLQGFDRIMPEHRPFPRPLPRILPRPSVSITIGAPLPLTPQTLPSLFSYRSSTHSPSSPTIPHLPNRRPLRRVGEHPRSWREDSFTARSCRIQTAEWIRQQVQRLGQEVESGRGDGEVDGRRKGFGGPGLDGVAKERGAQ